ncbi:diiron oxygenase [Kineosporia sp. J2-2]|uniref:Diiron oxygenase n=1 Tax=Kineosporia corallincola TaxID=2835133 RepID=A0ABS5TJA0_9ACTN|nr:diiron oxygenase [Kineosporia corallincola]MBT0770291.1 diiron oxygenase [Kineosporia corallincola]
MSGSGVIISDRLDDLLARLSQRSIDDYYNPYKLFDWPESIPTTSPWMSPELTTWSGTEAGRDLDQETQIALSRFESANFYSLNVHGIRELLVEVVNRIHTPDFARLSEFFHHFIGEENEHMWFFAEFCQRYVGRIYRAPAGGVQAIPEGEPATVIVFARILIFEELVDAFNTRMAEDETLHPTIRAINRIHHQDESRHIAFGREIVKLLFTRYKAEHSADEVRQLQQYLSNYIDYSFRSLFNPSVYRDAGIPEPVRFRTRLIEDPRSAVYRDRLMRKTLKFLQREELLSA